MSQPNILWICSDQQRWDTLGCTGNKYVRTPVLDELAANGTVFHHAYSQSPVCTPSRASFLTGRYPCTTRCRQNGQDIPETEILLPRLLRDAGYSCGLSGKLHLSACNPSVTPEMERRINDGYETFHWSHDPWDEWGDHNEYWKWLREKGGDGAPRPHPESDKISIGPEPENHQTTWCADKAIDFMQRDHNSPWMFSVNLFDPHHPFDAPAVYLNRYLDTLDELPLPNYTPGELDDKPPWQQRDHAGAYHGQWFGYDDFTEKDHRLVRASYFAMCDLIDDQVGRMIDTLKATGQYENTIIVYMSDHGEMLGDHGIYLKGPFFYDGAIRVPLIVSWPGKVQAQESDALVELLDVSQTLLDAVGIAHHPGMQGRSLWPLLQGETETHKDTVFCEYFDAMCWGDIPGGNTTMVRTTTHKLAVAHREHSGELYDLVKDPQETCNLWNNAVYADVKTELLCKLTDRLAETVDPLPPRRAEW
jgi:choline-sulfatase